MSSAPDTPQTRVYDALLTLVMCPEMQLLIDEGNVVRYDVEDLKQPKKTGVSDADVPELILVDSGITCNPFDSTSTSDVKFNFDLMISTGDMRWKEVVAQVNWILLCQLHQWRTLLAAIEWKGRTFVKNVKPTSIVVGETNRARSTGLEGWTTIWTFLFDCKIPISDFTISEG